MAWEAIGRDRPIQGNLDPAVLLGPPARLEQQVQEIVRRAGTGGGHIFNLGHGVLPETQPEAVEVLVRQVHEYGRAA
jgi:uroporphyrinogen decarboxylase